MALFETIIWNFREIFKNKDAIRVQIDAFWNLWSTAFSEGSKSSNPAVGM